MKKSELKKQLSAGFKAKLSPLGFKKSKYGFVKIDGDYSYSFIISSVDRYDFFPTNFAYSLRCSSIGKILKNIIDLHEDSYPYYPVMSQGQADLYEMKRYPLFPHKFCTESDAAEVIEQVSSYFIGTALPYMESISSLEALEKLTNQQPHPYSIRTGPLLGKLVNNASYLAIVQEYRESLKNWKAEWDKKDFEAIVTFLDAHSVEELQRMISA